MSYQEEIIYTPQNYTMSKITSTVETMIISNRKKDTLIKDEVHYMRTEELHGNG